MLITLTSKVSFPFIVGIERYIYAVLNLTLEIKVITTARILSISILNILTGYKIQSGPFSYDKVYYI